MTDFNDFHIVIVIICAVVLDSILGEPRRYHPLVFFGRFASALEKRLNKRPAKSVRQQRMHGIAGVILCLLPLVAITWAMVHFFKEINLILESLLLYLAIGQRSLIQHAERIYQSLLVSNMPAARDNVAMIVSRDTHTMDKQQVTQATIESVLENGNDAIFAVIFWYLIAGAPGVMMYRLANTLDAMWGYRTPRFLHFGWAAAKLDDLLNWIPARLCALTYAILGNFRSAFHSWITQAKSWESSNAGSVMSAGAGAMGIILGGDANYHGQNKSRPILGTGETPTVNDIKRAIQLVHNGVYLWIATVFTINTLIVIAISIRDYA